MSTLMVAGAHRRERVVQTNWISRVLVASVLMVAPLAARTLPAVQFGGQPPSSQQPGAAAQNPAGQNPGGQNPGSQNPGSQSPSGAGPANRALSPLNRPGGIDEFSSIWTVPAAPNFSGFPTFPARLPGYGNYPLPVDPMTGATPADPDSPFVLPLAPAEPEPRGWPTWIRSQAKKPLPFDLNLGLLISQSGRVWHRDSESEPFTPLFLHDKFASLPVGAEAETRAASSLEVLLHESTRVQARGVTKLKVLKLDAESVEIAFAELTWLRVNVTGRSNRLVLPDGSSLELVATEPPSAGLSSSLGMPLTMGMPNPMGLPTPTGMPDMSAAGAVPNVPFGLPQGVGAPSGFAALFGLGGPVSMMRPPAVEIERVSEPGWYGGRATLTNQGGTDILWRHAFGETRIPPEHRVTIFLSPPTAPTSADLVTKEARVEHQGTSLTCRADLASEVQWCGATIQLPKGASATFETLLGEFGSGAAVPGQIKNPTAATPNESPLSAESRQANQSQPPRD